MQIKEWNTVYYWLTRISEKFTRIGFSERLVDFVAASAARTLRVKLIELLRSVLTVFCVTLRMGLAFRDAFIVFCFHPAWWFVQLFTWFGLVIRNHHCVWADVSQAFISFTWRLLLLVHGVKDLTVETDRILYVVVGSHVNWNLTDFLLFGFTELSEVWMAEHFFCRHSLRRVVDQESTDQI